MGRFVTQRDEPRLALIATALRPSMLELTIPGRESLSISLAGGGAQRYVDVWRDTVPAIDAGDGVAAWLSSWLGRELRLVRFDPTVRRYCDPSFARNSGAHTAFADAYPLLVLSRASLADLNARLESPLSMRRRPLLGYKRCCAWQLKMQSDRCCWRFIVSSTKRIKPLTSSPRRSLRMSVISSSNAK